MKKILSFLIILIFAVLCSACINNYAVQQLNQKAKEYSDKGDLEAAASRLESSIDLDGNIFESRYNLAVIYVKLEKCDKALEQTEIAKNMDKPDSSIYYIEGLANSCMADKIKKNDENDNPNSESDEEKILSLDEAQTYCKYLKNANNAFEMYLNATSQNSEEVNAFINKNNELINEYSQEYGF